jgi:hypothetical protein
MFDLVYMCLIGMQKGKKRHLCKSGKFRSFSVKWVRMGGKIKIYEGCSVKSQELTFKPKWR